ncbi:DnaB-like helicase C-terminal domain-containing protein [uncultured Sphaerochaeta sp.]|uniref:DnaB-like helicase C-terminal domain-containing protein n=1 Tax=uncultured Sphaerochaeta sp. TaxID=886478 RepID=UPI002624D016|nr:DnaB-like helicase C-terminal domain-containing protein [uncultured Sphaerochaeta sp.]
MQEERYFIGQILWDPTILNKTIVTPSDFQGEQERGVFEAMLALSRENSVVDENSTAKKSGIPLGTILDLKSSNVICATWEHYQKVLIDASRVRAIKKTCERVLKSDQPADALVDMFIEETQDVRGRMVFRPCALPSCIEESIAALEARIKSKKIPGHATGYPILDSCIGGLQKTRLYYVGARPSQGKSTLLMNLVVNCNVPCIIFSAESSKSEFADRMIIREKRINSSQYYNGTLTKDDAKKVVEASSELYDRNYIIIHDEPNIPLSRLVQIARDAKRYNKVEAIFIDYVQLLVFHDQSRPKNEQVSEISKLLKQLARELDVPVICAAQLRRDAEGKKPQLSDFSDSTQLERDADVAIMIYHIDKKEGSDNNRETFLLIEKNRDGRLGYIRMNYHPEFMLFEEACNQQIPRREAE